LVVVVMVGAGVILFDPIFQGLAISLMAGEVASTLLSRLAVPELYYMSEVANEDGAVHSHDTRDICAGVVGVVNLGEHNGTGSPHLSEPTFCSQASPGGAPAPINVLRRSQRDRVRLSRGGSAPSGDGFAAFGLLGALLW
jgi:hypothetical protein